MNRREFLNLAVRVAGTIVILPHLGPTSFRPTHHPIGDHAYFVDQILSGRFQVARMRAFLKTNHGMFIGDALRAASCRQPDANTYEVGFEDFGVVEPFILEGFTFFDEHGYVLCEKPSSHKIATCYGDIVKLTYSLTF